MEEIFAASRVVVLIAFLSYASWSDYKTREVSNGVWLILAPIALSLSLAQVLIFEPSQIWIFTFCFLLTAGFALLLFYFGGFGGADSKALMCIALALPFFPTRLTTPILAGGLSPLSQILFPLTILSNSVLIAALSALGLLLWNVGNRLQNNKPLFEGSLAYESLGKKVLVLVTGKKIALSELKAKWHIYPLEDFVGKFDGPEIRKLLVIPRDEGREEIVHRLSLAADQGKISPKVWASPGLPMLIFITVGLIMALTLGDVVWVIVTHLFGSII